MCGGPDRSGQALRRSCNGPCCRKRASCSDTGYVAEVEPPKLAGVVLVLFRLHLCASRPMRRYHRWLAHGAAELCSLWGAVRATASRTWNSQPPWVRLSTSLREPGCWLPPFGRPQLKQGCRSAFVIPATVQLVRTLHSKVQTLHLLWRLRTATAKSSACSSLLGVYHTAAWVEMWVEGT